MTRTRRSFPMLLALAILFALAWPPTAAQAQISLSISPATVTVMPGGTVVFVFGTLTNSGATSVDLDNAFFNPLSGPAGADLTSAMSFSGYSAPFTLTAGQVYSGTLFTLDTQSNAPLGDYLSNFEVSYGGQSANQNFTVTLKSASAVPEPSPLVTFFVAGTGLLGLIVVARKHKKATANAFA